MRALTTLLDSVTRVDVDSPRSPSELDRLILAALQLDGRAPWNVVARVVGSTETTVARRAQRLIDAGQLRVIGVVDVLRCGLGVPVLARLRCAPGTARVVGEALAARTDARFVTVVSGSADCVAEFVVPERASLLDVIGPDLAASGRVADVRAYTVLRGFRAVHDWDPGLLDDDAVALLRPHEVPPFESGPQFAEPELLDELDLALAAELVEDGRRSYKELAAALDSSETTVARRLDSLVQRGCIRFRTLAEPVLLGFDQEVMLWANVTPARLEQAGTAIATHPAVKYLVATAGPHQLVGRVALRHHENLYEFLTETIGGVAGVSDAELTVEIATLKRSWVAGSSLLRTSTPATRTSHTSTGLLTHRRANWRTP